MGTFLSWLSLLIGVVALAYSWKLQQELQTARRRLDRYNRALFDANDEIRQLRADLHERTAALRMEMMQQSGQAAFTPQMTVREATLLHPQAEQILAGFHLGGCSSCAVDADDTLTAICQAQGADLTQLLHNLNLLLPQTPDSLAGQRNGHTPTTFAPTVKIPNVELNF
ncbi:MAG: hypothetical protein R3C14_03940 [Caldilineaceae bacterium]